MSANNQNTSYSSYSYKAGPSISKSSQTPRSTNYDAFSNTKSYAVSEMNSGKIKYVRKQG